jgi:heavy metal-binding protein
MHPDMTSDAPRDCSICGMALELVPLARSGPKGMAKAEPEHEVQVSPIGRNSFKPVVQHVFSQAVEVPAWVDGERQIWALLYNDELDGLSAEGRLTVAFDASQAPLEVVRAAVPVQPWDEATARVGFWIQSRDAVLPARGSVGKLLLPARRRGALVVPEAALLAQGDGPYVLVRNASADGLEQRHVTLGKVQYDMATVVGGLGPHEQVLVRNAFLLDAERRFVAGSAPVP